VLTKDSAGPALGHINDLPHSLDANPAARRA
jgi:hypothetical protein